MIKTKKVLFSLFVFVNILIILMPTVIWKLSPKVKTDLIINQFEGFTLVPKSVVHFNNENTYIFLLKEEKNLWIDRFIAKRISIEIIESGSDYYMISELFNRRDNLIIYENITLQDQMQVRKK